MLFSPFLHCYGLLFFSTAALKLRTHLILEIQIKPKPQGSGFVFVFVLQIFFLPGVFLFLGDLQVISVREGSGPSSYSPHRAT